MRSVLRLLIDSQIWLSRKFDTLFPAALRVDGYEDFEDDLCPRQLGRNQLVYDVGGGKNPFFDVARKAQLHASVVGVDIDASELARAPEGAYDRIVVTDICTYHGVHDADVVICQTLLEHVPNVSEAVRAMASMLKPGGRAVVFVPCRNAAFARLNLILPEKLKRALLFAIFPSMRTFQGFRSYYDHCTPANFIAFAAKNGLRVEEQRMYYKSDYFSFFFPLYALWRIWTLVASWTSRELVETFAMVLLKVEPAADEAST